MPKIYLSPSTQEGNPYVNGGNEEQYMNLVADAMIPYLRSSGIQYTRNTPDMTAAQSIRASNAGNYDFHIALHSNAAPESNAGNVQGAEVYYYPNSADGKRMADILVKNLKEIYPGRVRALTTTYLGEVTKTRAPAVLIEFAYHDNVEDANWIKNNIQNMAIAVVKSLCEYFDIPFVQPQPPRTGTVTLNSGRLNIRSKPSLTAPVLTQAYNGAKITVLGQWENWYVVNYNGTVGYAASRYITV